MNDKENEKESQFNAIEEEKNNTDLAFLLFPLIYFYYCRAEKFATNKNKWVKLFTSRGLNLKLSIIAAPLLLCNYYFVVKSVFHGDFKSAGVIYFASIILQYPVAQLVLLYKLNSIVMTNENGLIDPPSSYKIRLARYFAGCKIAEIREATSFNSVLEPRNMIGYRVIPANIKIPILKEPKMSDLELDVLLEGPFATFPLNADSPDHHVLIGQSGSGKTTLISRIVSAALLEGWRVAILDLKGDPSDIPLFSSLTPSGSIFAHFPTFPFDFWRGTKDEVAERVVSLLPEDSEPYYLIRNTNAIDAVIKRTSADTPKSVDELIHRLRNAMSFVSNIDDIKFFNAKERGTPIGDSIANDVSSQLNALRNTESNNQRKFTWSDNWQLALFTLDGFKPSALRMANAILNDFASWIFSQERWQNKSPMLIVIDEASALGRLAGVPVLTALMQRARSARVSIVIASQTYTAFGDDSEELIHSGAIRWLGVSSKVDEMIEATGTRSVIESGHQSDSQKYTGTVTHRIQKEFKIDPDLVRSMPKFHWFVASNGKVTSVYVPPLNRK